MQYVSEQRFLELLNEALEKDARASDLPRFTYTPQKFTWPGEDPWARSIYWHAANQVKARYEIR